MQSPQTSRPLIAIAHGLAAALALVVLSGCAAKLVQPYDDQLVTGTEALFKTASTVIDDGFIASPLTDATRAAIQPPETNPAHYSKFEPRYDGLIRDSDVLILRSMAGSYGIDPLGQTLQGKIEAVIDSAIPSVCDDLDKSFEGLGPTSFEVRNYVDLKCLLTRWREQHADPELTRQTLILKKANWEARRAGLFRIVLAIERAELSKKKP